MLLTMKQAEQTVYLCTKFKQGPRNNCSFYTLHVRNCSLHETGSFINSSAIQEALRCLQLFKLTCGFSVLRLICVKWNFNSSPTSQSEGWERGSEAAVIYLVMLSLAKIMYSQWYVNAIWLWGIILTGENDVLRKEQVPLPLYPPQTHMDWPGL
jgi:hypothetical protein